MAYSKGGNEEDMRKSWGRDEEDLRKKWGRDEDEDIKRKLLIFRPLLLNYELSKYE